MKKLLNHNNTKAGFLILIIICTVFIFYDHHHRDKIHTKEYLENLTAESNKQFNAIVSMKLNDEIELMQAYALQLASLESLPSESSFEIILSLLDCELNSRIAITDANGMTYTSDRVQQDNRDSDYYHAAMKGETFISDVIVSDIDQKEIIILAVPIKNDDQILGVLRSTIPIANLDEYFELSFLSGNMNSFILQSDGKNLTMREGYKQNIFTMLQENPKNKETADKMKLDLKNHTAGHIEFYLDGTSRCAYYSPIPHTNWIMLTVLPTNFIQQYLTNDFYQTFQLAIKISLIFIISGAYIFYLRKQGSDKLKIINKRLHAIISNTPGVSFRHDIETPHDIEFLTQEKRLYAGYRVDEILTLIREDIHSLIVGEDFYELQLSLQDLKPNVVVTNTYRIRNKEQKILWIYDQRQIIQEGDRWICYVSIMDITEMKTTQDQLKISQERYQMILNETQSVVFEWNLSEDTVILSPLWKEKYGYSCVLENFLIYTRNKYEASQAYVPLIEDLISGRIDSGQIEYLFKKADGQSVWIQIIAKSILDENGYLLSIIGSISDIDDQKQTTMELMELAQRDGLTNVYNRTTLVHLIEQELLTHPNTYHALFVIDVDDFKSVNDTLGHSSGDEALEKISKALLSCFRSGDYIGRIGGDEFVVFMNYNEALPTTFIEQKCEYLLHNISNIRLQQNQEHRIHCSIGIALHPRDGDTYEDLFEQADRRLYEAKEIGKNTYIHSDIEKTMDPQ